MYVCASELLIILVVRNFHVQPDMSRCLLYVYIHKDIHIHIKVHTYICIYVKYFVLADYYMRHVWFTAVKINRDHKMVLSSTP